MSETSDLRSREFLKISDQFKLGVLTTESSHPATSELSQTAKTDIAAALALLFTADEDVLRKYGEFARSPLPHLISAELVQRIRNGGKIFFTGCGSTGRLSIQLVSLWRHFWQEQRAKGSASPATLEFEHRAFSVMAGGDFALIKSVEGFEDFTAFGKKQIDELGVGNKDTVFAITEGGETSFVIGTAWKGVEAGAKVYFVYNNPDDVLCEHVQRSREVINDARIEKLNLTTGPMAITGSTRMQATTIQLCVLLTVLEMVIRELLADITGGARPLDTASIPLLFLNRLEQFHSTLASEPVRKELAALVALEESVYRSGHKLNYFAHQFAIDVLTDTTERSPTYCTPPFRKFDDTTATESWAFLFVNSAQTFQAWEHILKRSPRCVEWSESEIRELVPKEKFARTLEIVRKISRAELMRFKVGLDGIAHRKVGSGDAVVAVLSDTEAQALFEDGFVRGQLDAGRLAGAATGLLFVGSGETASNLRRQLPSRLPGCTAIFVAAPSQDHADATDSSLLLDGVTRVGLKILLNALSTCTMVRLGRVMGNYMIWVVPSNLKLIDRSTRYIQKLTGLDYTGANRLLFEVIEYVEPRMKTDQAYPPVVGMAVLRAKEGLTNEQAEQKLSAGGGV